jgi:general secretion pathway protein F
MTMQFQVRSILLGDTAVNQQLLEASDEESLRAQLIAQGKTVLSLRKVGGLSSFFQSFNFKSSKKNHSFPLFCREIRTLTQAGMTVVEAVDTLAAREKLAGETNTLPMVLLEQLNQGKSLSTALAVMKNAPPVLIAAVRAGERTSNLGEALKDYLRFDTLVEQLRRKVISASIYPALVSSLGIAISAFLLLGVMPNFAKMYQNLRSTTSLTTSMIIAVSSFMSKNQLEVIVGLLILIMALSWCVVTGRAKKSAIKFAMWIPFIRHKIQDFYLAMMYQTLALLLKGGYSMTEAMSVAGQSALSPEVKESLSISLQRIEQGGLVSQSLSATKLCDEVGRRLMAAAERNGDFHIAADVVSTIHRERFELFVERMTRIIEPVLLMVVALMVGTIVVMMYLPIFDMTTRMR